MADCLHYFITIALSKDEVEIKESREKLRKSYIDKYDIDLKVARINLIHQKMMELQESMGTSLNQLYKEDHDGLIDEIRKMAELRKTNMVENTILRTVMYHIVSLKKDKPKAKKPKAKPATDRVKWSTKKYNRWLKKMVPDDDIEPEADYARDMALNAKQEKDLIPFIERKIEREGGTEKALERIQWDLEAII